MEKVKAEKCQKRVEKCNIRQLVVAICHVIRRIYKSSRWWRDDGEA